MKCTQCQYVYINGVGCHETGCPEMWKNQAVHCFECGFPFLRNERYQKTCENCQLDLVQSDTDEVHL